ncbi:MAG TPA: glycosyltransferase family 4 protein [Stellaceae bacterium]|jgi:glycosyltransferase involved in cell wall biosynthesis|nr:glycosyltransferase family 4 protein [Stellaceae bacterium]
MLGPPEDSPQQGRPPAVLQIVPSLVSGGAERGTVELAAALIAAGWNAYVASSGGPLEHDIARAGGTHLTLPLASKNPLVMRRNRTALVREIRRLGIDIVHARSRAPAWSAWSAAAATGRHFVTTFHNAYAAGSALKRRYNSVMARGERVIAISDFVADHAASVYGVGADRLRTIPRGVDLDLFDPRRVGGQRIASLARQWRLPDGLPTVMLPGRLTRWKGGLDFIAAMAALGRRDICCVLVGAEQRPGFRRQLEAAIEGGGLAGSFRIVEHCADMPAAYMLADVVVSASTDPEGFGRVIVEAQAMGRPVVATDHGGARETIVPGETGWLAPARDPAALAAAIGEALWLGPGERSRLAARAIAHIAQNFTREAMCARTIAVYEELLFPDPVAAAEVAPATAALWT